MLETHMVMELHETCISNTTLVFKGNLDLVKTLCDFSWGITELFDFDLLVKVEVVLFVLAGHLGGGEDGKAEIWEGWGGVVVEMMVMMMMMR